MLKSIILGLLLMTILVQPVFADFKGFTQLSNGHELYTDYVQPKSGQPLVVLVNGLGYTTEFWNDLVAALGTKDFGILRYDPMGMGQTLDKIGSLYDVIRIDDQVEDLRLLLDTLGISQKVDLVGLSYGGGLSTIFAATYPQRIRHVVLISPYTQPLAQQDNWIQSQVMTARMLNPFNPMTDDEMYDFYLRIAIGSSFLAELEYAPTPLRLEGIFRLTQGIRKMRTENYSAQIPAGTLHLMLGEDDQFVTSEYVRPFWDALSPEARMSRIQLRGTQHDVPREAAKFSAEWLKLIINNDPRLSGGKHFVGTPTKNEARAPGVDIKF